MWRATKTSIPETRRSGCSKQVVDAVREDEVIAYPTDSGYDPGRSRIGNREGRDRTCVIRGLDERHHFTLVWEETSSQLGQLAHVDNAAFRAIRAATPGPYTLPPGHSRGAAAAAAPQEAHHRRKRIPDHAGCTHSSTSWRAAVSSTLILPGETEPRTHGWDVKERSLRPGRRPGHRRRRDSAEPTTVIDWSDGAPDGARYGAGDATRLVA